jgi:hypothetical protein
VIAEQLVHHLGDRLLGGGGAVPVISAPD